MGAYVLCSLRGRRLISISSQFHINLSISEVDSTGKLVGENFQNTSQFQRSVFDSSEYFLYCAMGEWMLVRNVSIRYEMATLSTICTYAQLKFPYVPMPLLPSSSFMINCTAIFPIRSCTIYTSQSLLQPQLILLRSIRAIAIRTIITDCNVFHDMIEIFAQICVNVSSFNQR